MSDKITNLGLTIEERNSPAYSPKEDEELKGILRDIKAVEEIEAKNRVVDEFNNAVFSPEMNDTAREIMNNSSVAKEDLSVEIKFLKDEEILSMTEDELDEKFLSIGITKEENKASFDRFKDNIKRLKDNRIEQLEAAIEAQEGRLFDAMEAKDKAYYEFNKIVTARQDYTVAGKAFTDAVDWIYKEDAEYEHLKRKLAALE